MWREDKGFPNSTCCYCWDWLLWSASPFEVCPFSWPSSVSSVLACLVSWVSKRRLQLLLWHSQCMPGWDKAAESPGGLCDTCAAAVTPFFSRINLSTVSDSSPVSPSMSGGCANSELERFGMIRAADKENIHYMLCISLQSINMLLWSKTPKWTSLLVLAGAHKLIQD